MEKPIKTWPALLIGLCLSLIAGCGGAGDENSALSDGATIEEVTDLPCSADAECSDNYGLPAYGYAVTLNLDSCTLSSIGSGYICWNSFCAYADTSTGAHSSSGGDGVSNGWAPGKESGISDVDFSNSSENPQFARSGYNGSFCEETTECAPNIDCPADSFCYRDDRCITESNFTDHVLPFFPSCESSSDCESDHECLLVDFGSSYCASYCVEESYDFEGYEFVVDACE